jgi:hypothetical protein
MDGYQAAISVAVVDDQGKLIMECILETKAARILEFVSPSAFLASHTLESGGCMQV